jgi:uncharacterized protein (TIGR02594 family)
MTPIQTYQKAMQVAGVYAGRVDGVFGPLTLAAAQVYELGKRGPVPVWMLHAAQELGVSEILGARHNPRILEYGRSTSLKPSTDEVPWCATFVNWCLHQAAVGGTNSAVARSFDSWGRKTLIRFGAVVTFPRTGGSGRHVAFVAGWNTTHIFHLGGNQSNAVNVQASPRSSATALRWPRYVD